MATTASFVIEFGSVTDGLLTAELDSDRNNGKTSFTAGDVVYFRVYSSIDYAITASSGVIANEVFSETEEILVETISFVNTNSADTSKKIISIGGQSWYAAGGGNDYGNVTIVPPNAVVAVGGDQDSLGVLSLDYTTQYDVWKLTPPLGMPQKYHIVVLIQGE